MLIRSTNPSAVPTTRTTIKRVLSWFFNGNEARDPNETAMSPPALVSGDARFTPELIQLGRSAFRACFKQQLCGPTATESYQAGLARPSGPVIAIGAIIACLEHRLRRRDELIGAAARVARCKRDQVRIILDELTGHDEARHLWCLDDDGDYAILCVSGVHVYDRTRLPTYLPPELAAA